MRVLVACEFSGIVRDAFAALGHDAWSCDLLETERPGNHLQCDARDVLRDGWDLLVAHPPCTDLAASGAQWWARKRIQRGPDFQKPALDLVRAFLFAPIPHVAVENPIGAITKAIMAPSQTIQPWMFGHGEVKATCLWLRGLPELMPTEIVEGRRERSQNTGQTADRWKRRSRTLPGIAAAMAAQWGAELDVAAYRLRLRALGRHDLITW